MTFALVLMLCLVTFSGCLGIFEEDEGLTDGMDQSAQEDSNMTAEEDSPPLPGRINGTVLVDGNATVADVNLTLQRLDDNGTGAANESGGLEPLTTTSDDDGQFIFEEVSAGEYRLSANATCCSEFNTTLELEEGENKTLDVDLESLQLAPAPEGGVVEGTATGATAAVLATDDIFELVNGGHAQIELIVELDDPLAQLGQSYSFRLELPDDGEENYDAENGEPIVTESVMEGQYDMVVWPVVAGSYDWSVTWCAFTDTHCEDA